MEVKTKKSFNDILESLVEEIIEEEELEEFNTTGSVGGATVVATQDRAFEAVQPQIGLMSFPDTTSVHSVKTTSTRLEPEWHRACTNRHRSARHHATPGSRADDQSTHRSV